MVTFDYRSGLGTIRGCRTELVILLVAIAALVVLIAFRLGLLLGQSFA